MAAVTAPILRGALRERARAVAFAQVVERVHHRYASEIVGRYTLCPHMNDPASAFGRFCVMLDREPDLEDAVACVVEAGAQVCHLIYPLIATSRGECAPFERFGNALHKAVAKAMADAPVHATFHPAMEGDPLSASRIVGFLRRAPDPFVQFVPEGLHKGGTVFADVDSFDLHAMMSAKKKERDLLARLSPSDIAAIEEGLRDIRRDRDDSYAEFLDAFA